MLWQHWYPTLVTNIETIFRQCYANVVMNITPKIGDWHWDNIQATLGEWCRKFATHNWWLMLFQCHPPTLGTKCWDKAQAKLCTNAGPQHWTYNGPKGCTNIAVQYCTCSCNVHNDCYISIQIVNKFEYQQASLHWNIHTHEHFWLNLPTRTVEFMGRWWIFLKCPQ